MRQKPIIHGRDHACGGADPVPGICNLVSPPVYPDAILIEPCLTHYWPADEPTGNLIDRKGSWDLAMVTHVDAFGAVWPVHGGDGPENYGFYGVANDDHGRFKYDTTAGITPPYTVELWLLLTSFSHILFPGDVDYTETGQCTALVVAPLNVYVGTSGHIHGRKLVASHLGADVVDIVDFPLSSWQYIAVRHTGSQLDLFRNGTLKASVAASSAGSTANLSWMNQDAGPSWSPWHGFTSNLALYNCALSDSVIAQHANLFVEGGNPGYVLTANGDGTVSYQAPTITVIY